MTDLSPLLPLARDLITRCAERGLSIVAAESCTGGLVAGVLTEISGSSMVVDRSFVTYSNAAKAEMLGVSVSLIERVGAVSEEVARAMAEGASARTAADLAIAVTGIAGPTGGSPAKPVGLVHFAALRRGGTTLHAERRFGDIGRSAVRLASVETALGMLYGLVAMER
ncbi:MAG TPA: CinA family protein [Bauldia sp.]|nr:CinA family protein [Bauldia sp.]